MSWSNQRRITEALRAADDWESDPAQHHLEASKWCRKLSKEAENRAAKDVIMSWRWEMTADELENISKNISKEAKSEC